MSLLFGQPSNRADVNTETTRRPVVFCDTFWVMEKEFTFTVPVSAFDYAELIASMISESRVAGSWLTRRGCRQAVNNARFQYLVIDVRHRLQDGMPVGEFKIIFSHEMRNERPSNHQLDGIAYHLAGKPSIPTARPMTKDADPLTPRADPMPAERVPVYRAPRAFDHNLDGFVHDAPTPISYAPIPGERFIEIPPFRELDEQFRDECATAAMQARLAEYARESSNQAMVIDLAVLARHSFDVAEFMVAERKRREACRAPLTCAVPSCTNPPGASVGYCETHTVDPEYDTRPLPNQERCVSPGCRAERMEGFLYCSPHMRDPGNVL